jgi:Putative beta-lactamase-inhibitor-like, PepSY-like
MKSLLISTLFSVLVLCPAAPAQVLTTEQVPAAVKQAMQAKFPDVKSPEWKLKSDKNYEAEFSRKGTSIAAKFDPAGKWLETESAISRSKLPKAVRATVDKQFKGYKTVETQTVQRCNDDQLIYELHLDNAKEVVKAQFSADGSVLSQSAKAKPGPAK